MSQRPIYRHAGQPTALEVAVNTSRVEGDSVTINGVGFVLGTDFGDDVSPALVAQNLAASINGDRRGDFMSTQPIRPFYSLAIGDTVHVISTAPGGALSINVVGVSFTHAPSGIVDLGDVTYAQMQASNVLVGSICTLTDCYYMEVEDGTLQGLHIPDGTANGKNAYLREGASTSEYWDGSQWLIYAGTLYFNSPEDVSEPWQVTTWNAVTSTPVPTLIHPVHMKQTAPNVWTPVLPVTWNRSDILFSNSAVTFATTDY